VTKIRRQGNMIIFCKTIISFFPRARIIELFRELKLNCLRREPVKIMIRSSVSGRKVDFN